MPGSRSTLLGRIAQPKIPISVSEIEIDLQRSSNRSQYADEPSLSRFSAAQSLPYYSKCPLVAFSFPKDAPIREIFLVVFLCKKR